MVDTADYQRRPSVIWFKAQAPGFRFDGSSLVTLAFARELAGVADLHLVYLPTKATIDDPAARSVPPFASATVIEPAHHGGLVRRVVVGGWFMVLDAFGIRPLASSVESSGRVCRALADHAVRVSASHLVSEHWTTGRVHERCELPSTLVMIDVEHENRADKPSSVGFARGIARAWKTSVVRREEQRACTSANQVIFLSAADKESFERAGVTGGSVVRVPAQPQREPKQASGRGNRLVMLGGFTWWPNAEGVEWFFNSVWPEVLHRCPDALLKVVGPAPDDFAERWVSEHVTFVGFVSDLAQELSSNDLGVVPVRFGTGVKTKSIDLLAAGLPIVSTTNGVRGTSAESEGALLRDDPIEFAAAVCELIYSPDARNRLAVNGRARFLAEHGAPLDPTYFVGTEANTE